MITWIETWNFNDFDVSRRASKSIEDAHFPDEWRETLAAPARFGVRLETYPKSKG